MSVRRLLSVWRSSLLLAVGVWACCAAAGQAPDRRSLRDGRGEAVRFAAEPRAVREQGKITVTFALSTPADVEVAVLGPKGEVVRHLAAGVLGAQSPPPEPLGPGLSQRIVWDGRADLGKPAGDPGAPGFQVRLRAGLSVRFGRMIGQSPYTGVVDSMPYRAPVNGLAVDREGNLYVKMYSTVGSHGNSGLWPWHVRQFDKTGKYVRTILPYPPSTDPAKATGFELLDTGDGFLTPALRTSLYPVFYAFGNELYNQVVDGSLLFVHTEARRLNFFKLDGSNALRTHVMWPDKAKLKCPTWLDIQVALSPDGRYAYYSNVAGTAYDGKTPSDIDADWPQGRIYRQDLTELASRPEVFYDLKLPDWQANKYWMPSAWDKKTAAAGIAVGPKGNVFVCDLVNHEVVEVGPDGRKLSATKAPWPDKVMVHPASGDLYVICRKVSRGEVPPGRLLAISGRGADAKVRAELALPGTVGAALALYAGEKEPVLWLAGGTPAGTKLLRVVDHGDRLDGKRGQEPFPQRKRLLTPFPDEADGDSVLNRDVDAIEFVGYLDVDPQADLVYVTNTRGTVWRYNGQSGEGGPVKIKAVDLAVGPGGMVYAWGTGSYAGPVARYTRDLDPAPLSPGTKHTYGHLDGRAGRGCSVCGIDVDARGNVYATWGSNDCHVLVYDASGSPRLSPRKVKIHDPAGKEQEVPALITGVSGYGGSIRADSAGNVYLAQQGLPKGHTTPPGFEKDAGYRSAVGTILKFGPQGGERSKAPDPGAPGLGFGGVLKAYPGCGPISRWNCVGACACTKPRFDVDGYGRLYVPNAVTFQVWVCDNAGNEIVRFGQYGNFDAQGRVSREPRPEIPLGWPVAVGASDRFIYVGDCLNHRVVRVDKAYAAETTCAIGK